MTDTTPLLLLHGAMQSSGVFSHLLPLLQRSVETHTLDFAGHGARRKDASPFTIETFASNVIEFDDRVGRELEANRLRVARVGEPARRAFRNAYRRY